MKLFFFIRFDVIVVFKFKCLMFLLFVVINVLVCCWMILVILLFVGLLWGGLYLNLLFDGGLCEGVMMMLFVNVLVWLWL